MYTKGTITSLILIYCIIMNNNFCYASSLTKDISADDAQGAYFEPGKPIEESLEEMYQDVFMTMLLPYIQNAVDDYYEKNKGCSPVVDPWLTQVIYTSRPNGYRTFLFEMKLKLMPYLGAHNSIGVDHITIKVSIDKVEVIKFEHIKDFPIPPWLLSSDKQNIKTTSTELADSIPQTNWESLNCQDKEYLLERLIMNSYALQIEEAVDNYYLTKRGFDIERIIDVKSVGPYEYEMQLQISTYIGAHNPPYGTDIITIHLEGYVTGK